MGARIGARQRQKLRKESGGRCRGSSGARWPARLVHLSGLVAGGVSVEGRGWLPEESGAVEGWGEGGGQQHCCRTWARPHSVFGRGCRKAKRRGASGSLVGQPQRDEIEGAEFVASSLGNCSKGAPAGTARPGGTLRGPCSLTNDGCLQRRSNERN